MYLLLLLPLALSTSPSSRAKELLAKMNLDDKIAMVHGTAGPYVGNVLANPRLSIPALNLNDGPQGFRAEKYPGTTSAFPCALSIGASWDPSVAFQWGSAMGKEFAAKGANIQLGPGVNVMRVPLDGRNFEYISGEDPYLGKLMVPGVIQGIQKQNVMACVKHYINNNQETKRNTIDANLDERTEWEIYLQPFVSASEAGAMSFMCSYNKINGDWACENKVTLTTYLKDGAGFAGFVMSDWGGTHSTVKAALAGLDQEMPSDVYFGAALKTAVENKSVPEDNLDDKVLRILTPMFGIGLFDNAPSGNISANVTSAAHNNLNRQLASSSVVLLKNNGALPIAPGKLRIAVIGSAGDEKPIVVGDGSGTVAPPYVVTILQGIKNRAGPDATVTYDTNTRVVDALENAKKADIAIVVTATTSGEGHDRENLSLPLIEDALMDAVSGVQPNTVAVVITPGPVLMPWTDKVAASILSFMPGQEEGNAIADVLFGLVNPSGHLPCTMPMTETDLAFTHHQYPGEPLIDPKEETYSEKLLVGYRYYDAHKIEPRFPFGHGLSYTTFKYSDPTWASTGITANITNIGAVAGAEVVQLYLAFPSDAGEPLSQLRGFSKVFLKPGQSTTVKFTLTKDDLSVWDVSAHAWKVWPGKYGAAIGASSRDIRLNGVFDFK